MVTFDRGQMPAVDEPWGFRGVRREVRNVRSDSRIFYVDPNNTLASDSNSGEDPMYPLLTITQGVTNCRAYKGDGVYVLSNDGWIYGSGTSDIIAETVVVPGTKPGISIVGVGAGSIGVYWSPAAAGETCLTINALDVTVEGFCFTGDGSAANGIATEWDGATLFGENIIIRNCAFADDIDAAISLEYSWYCTVHDCVFWECDTYGIYVDVAGSGIAYARIYDNIFHDCGTAAISLLGGCDYNHIYRNSIYNSSAQAAAAAANEGINTTGGARNQVHDNTFSCLLPVPANGDYDDLNTAAATDAWSNNHCMNGLATTAPT